MGKTRLEAFSDGVIAIIITIMVLELKVPHGATLGDLGAVWPVFVSYLLSFVFLGIYWNNHHHLLHTASKVSASVLWANLHLLLWLSLVPFGTAWMGETHFATVPVAVYGVVLICCGIAYFVLTRALIARHGTESLLAKAVGADTKGLISLGVYGTAIGLAFVNRWISIGLYALVAAVWLIPDRRIERMLDD